MAFLLKDYIGLIAALRNKGYGLGPVKRYFEDYETPFVFLRHDVDRLPFRAINMARAEHAAGIASTYYFRCTPDGRFNENHIRQIAGLGHETGYHYETIARNNGDAAAAFEAFKCELTALRKIADVKTVAAHGSPLSAHSNMNYTENIDMSELGLLGEPQVDFDYSKVLYITDTGGIFGSPHNRRDWSNSKNLRTPTSPQELGKKLIPDEEPLLLLNTHPERWPVTAVGLAQALVLDALVNLVKRRNTDTQ